MKQKKLASFLAVTLSLELMVSPLIPHVHAQNTSKPSVGETIMQGLQGAQNLWGSLNPQGGPGNLQSTADMAALGQQLTPQTDKYFNAQKLMQIPGLGEYLATNNINPNMLSCATLATTLYEAKPEVCRIGITDDSGLTPSAQMSKMFTYHTQYNEIQKRYKNYLADSNVDGQAFGIGCMNNAMNILNGFFKYRLNELDKLTTNLEALQDQFSKASRSDLDAIEEAVAVLEGDSELADKVRSKKPDLFDFSKRFNNPACNSMFMGEALNQKGRAGGLNSINQDIKTLLTDKKGKYSGESYSQSHNAVVEDITSVAEKVAKQFELNFTPNLASGDYSKLIQGASGQVSSTTGVQRSITADLLSDVQTSFVDSSAKLMEERQTIMSELRGSEKAMSLMGSLNSSAAFEAEVATLENNMKNECLSSSIGSVDTIINKIHDPTASSHANKYGSNFLKEKLRQILANDKTSIEKKLAEIRAAEATQGSSYLRVDRSYEVQDVDANGNLVTSQVVGASTTSSASTFFANVIKSCNAQFKANKLNNKLTGQAAIQRLRQLNQSYKQLAQTQSAKIKEELRKKLVECQSPEIANNTVAGSCTPDLFNTSSPGFCANAAFSCSKNMQACSKQAEGFVKEIKDQKTARVNNYKALVEKNKNDIVKIFDTALTRFMKDGEALRGLFGAGFSSPAGIKREVLPESSRYLSEFVNATGKPGSPDGKLLLEDPNKYVEMFKGNIDLLKKSVKEQQDQILGGESVGAGKNPGLLADHIKKTKTNFEAVSGEAAKLSSECLTKHDQAVASGRDGRAKQAEEINKSNTELGEKRSAWCDNYALAKDNPIEACKDTKDLTTEALKAVNTPEGKKAISEFSKLCLSHQNPSPDTAGVSFTTACYNVGVTSATGITTAKMTGEKAEALAKYCKETYALKCDPVINETDKGTETKTPDTCSKVTDARNLAVTMYLDLGTGSKDSHSITINDIDAGAICGSADNSTRDSGGGKSFMDSFMQQFPGAMAQGTTAK